MAFTYRQVKDLYDQLKDAGVVTSSLPEWSQEMNQRSGSDLYAEGLNDNWIKRTSVGLDRLLEKTGLPDFLGDVGASVGSWVGNEEAGRRIGKAGVRGAINFAPLLTGVGGVAKYGATALLSGADVYTQTGSPAAGVFGGLTSAAMPAVAGLGERAVLRGLGVKPLVGRVGPAAAPQAVRQFLPQNLTQGLLSQGGGQLAASVFGEATSAVQAGLDPKTEYHFSPTEALLNMTLGQLPFAGIYATHRGRVALGGQTTRQHEQSLRNSMAQTERLIAERDAQERLSQQTPLEKIPLLEPQPVNPVVEAQINDRLASLRGRQQELKAEPTTLDMEEFNQLSREENELMAQQRGYVGDGVVGVKIQPTTERMSLQGKEVFRNKGGTFRMIELPNGKRYGYSTLHEPEPTPTGTGEFIFSVPRGFVSEFENKPLTQTEGNVPVQTTPELPLQEAPGNVAFDHVVELQRAENELATAKAPAEFQSALVRLNAVREANNIAPLTDRQILKRAKRFNVSQERAAKSLVSATERQIQAERDAMAKAVAREAGVPDVPPENVGTKGGVPLLSLPKPNRNTAALHDFLDEVISAEQAVKDAAESFVVWQRSAPTSRDVTSLPVERERYKIFWRLRQQGDIGEEGTLSKQDAETLNAELREEGIGVDDAAVLVDFPERDHVLNWDDSVNLRVEQLRGGAAAPGANLPAGDGFVWGLEAYDPVTNRLGKHTLPKTGLLHVAQFKNMAGRGKPLPDVELELAKAVVPEAFEGTNVNVRKLYEGLNTKGPVVEVKKLGEGAGPKQGIAEAQHLLDTAGYSIVDDDYFKTLEDENGNNVDMATAPPEIVAAYETLITAAQDGADVSGARYRFVGPKSEQEMPGYVEGLVRAPFNKQPVSFEDYIAQRGLPDTVRTRTNYEKSGLSRPQYSGPHFGDEDTNVLAFFRGYEETLPNGKKAFHVIEVQSDWGQERRRIKEEGDQEGYGFISDRVGDHPLLRVYETLALKAAIQHAKSVGADAVILSDAETAMMTEGHDKQTRAFIGDQKVEVGHTGKFRPVKVGDWAATSLDGNTTVVGESQVYLEKFLSGKAALDQYIYKQLTEVDLRPSEPPQSTGMRLHYDQTLPSAMKKLTGQEGERVEVGTHNKAKDLEPTRGHFTTYEEAQAAARSNEDVVPAGPYFELKERGKIIGSPVFRNLDGTPKSSITGRLYNLDKVIAPANQGGFTVADPSRAPEPAYIPVDEGEVATVADFGLDRGAEGLLDYTLRSTDPIVRAIAEDLSQYRELFKRATASLSDRSGISTAQMAHNRFGNIALDSGVLKMSKEARDFTVLHELVHQATLAEYRNPTKAGLKDELDLLRQRMIESLPQELRLALDNAVAGGWMERYIRGEVPFDSLYPDRDKANLLYGLMNGEEFLAQGVTSGPVRNYMLSQKGKPQGWFKRFTNLVKNLLGIGTKVQGTAFEEFMGHTNALIERGNHVARFQNFAERFLEGQGLSRGTAKQQALRGLGLTLETGIYDVNPNQAFRLLNEVDGGRSPAYQRARNAIEKSVRERDADYENFVALSLEMQQEPTRQGLDEFFLDSLRGDVDPADFLEVLPDNVSTYLFEKARNMREVLDVMGASAAKENAGLLNLADPTAIRKLAQESISTLDRFLALEQKHVDATVALQGLEAVAPDGFFNKWTEGFAGPEAAAPAFFQDAAEGTKGFFKKLDRFLRPAAQYEDPLMREALSKGYQLQTNSNKMQTEAGKVLGIDLNSGELTKDSVNEVTKTISNPRLAKALNGWLFENQKNGKQTGKTTTLPLNDPRVQAHLKGLSDAEKHSLLDIVEKSRSGNQVMSRQILEKVQQIGVVNGAKIAGLSNDLKVTENMALAATVQKALGVDWNDPVAATTAQNELAAVQQRMSPEGFNDLLAFMQNQQEVHKTYKQFFDDNPAWVSGQRFGKYIVKFFRNGKPVVLGVDSKKEAQQVAGDAKYELSLRVKPGDEDVPNFGSDYPQIFERLRQLDEQQIEMARARGMSEEDIDFLRKSSGSLQFARESAGQGLPVPEAPPRGLTRGADLVPWLSNQQAWFQKISHYWSKQLFRAQMDAYIAQKEVPEQMKSDLRTHRDNILQADPESVQKLNAFVRTWFMGFNPANVIINAAQPFTTHVAELTSLTGKPLDSYRRVISALGEIGGRFAGRKEWSSPEIARLMDDAAADGEVGLSMFDDNAAVKEKAAIDFKRFANANKPQTMGQYLGSAFGAYTKAGMWMFRHGEQVNNRAALVAAFKLAREQGKSYDEAKAAAYDFNHRVNFGGGKAGRPVGAFSGRSPVLRGTAMLATAMQSYVLGTTFQIIRYLKSGLFRPQGLTPHEVWSARKAGIQMLGTQLAAAGLLGLPFVSGAIALLDKAFPELELNKGLRQSVSSFFNEDEENGNVMTDMAMTGLPSMLGWDMQSRLSMGNTLPGVSEVNGFQPENLLGPPANLISTFVNGGRKLVAGDSSGAKAFVPSALKKVTELLKGQGTLRDYRDRPTYTPTPGEGVGIFLGFQPKGLSDQNAAQRMAALSQTNANRREGEFRQQVAELVLKGNFGTAKQQLKQWKLENPDGDLATTVRAVARAAEEMTFPRDLRRDSRVDQKVLSFFNIPPTATAEVQRLRYRQGIEQMFGLTSTSTSEFTLASVMDQLRESNPRASRMELRRMAERMVRRQRSALQLPLE